MIKPGKVPISVGSFNLAFTTPSTDKGSQITFLATMWINRKSSLEHDQAANASALGGAHLL